MLNWSWIMFLSLSLSMCSSSASLLQAEGLIPSQRCRSAWRKWWQHLCRKPPARIWLSVSLPFNRLIQDVDKFMKYIDLIMCLITNASREISSVGESTDWRGRSRVDSLSPPPCGWTTFLCCFNKLMTHSMISFRVHLFLGTFSLSS